MKAALFLAAVLNVLFFPALWGNKTLLLGSRDTASIMPSGAYHRDESLHLVGRTPDPGAPAWTIEPWFKIVSEQYWHEGVVPLWNPYAAYGTPLAAAQQAQPFYPLTIPLSLDVTAKTFDVFLLARLFVAGFLMFLYARLFLSFLPALFSSVTYMLSGYFILYLNMPHLSVEVLAPGLLFTFELLLRRHSWSAVAAASGVIFCSIVGGMPEALFISVSFACLYFLFRMGTDREARAHPLLQLAKLAAALAFGFGLAAMLLLPFAELLRVGHDSHQVANVGDRAGLIGGVDLRTSVLRLLPLLLSAAPAPGTGIRSYWGVIPCVFAMTAVFGGLSPHSACPPALRRLTAFFSVSAVLMYLKLAGSPIINWIGWLPISEMVLYLKYIEPTMTLCVAMLAGIGLSLIVEWRIRRVYGVAATLAVAVILLGLAGWSLPLVRQHAISARVYFPELAAGIALIAAILSGLALGPTRIRWLGWGFLGLLIGELSADFILPDFYVLSSLPSTASTPYAGAPYVQFLQAQDTGYDRIFARDGFLYPNWAGVFKLPDVRSLDAMYYRRYIDFIRSFLLKPEDEARVHGDLADRFTGAEGTYDFASDREKRFLELSSIKYLISGSDYDWSPATRDEIVAQHKGENLWGFGATNFEVNGGLASGVLEHPPSTRITYKTTIDPARPIFVGFLAIQVAAQDKSDGAGFTLEIRQGDKTETLFHEFLDPRDVPADRRGRPFRVDLSRYAGTQVELLFSTDPGPSGINAFDWAGWARLGFVPPDNGDNASDSQALQRIYSHEALIYRVPHVLPRAALFTAAEVMPDGDVLQRLKDPGFDLAEKVILSPESLSTDSEAIHPFTMAPEAPAQAAAITFYGSQDVRIEADTSAPAVLMLNDTNYPGWRAYVNGNSARILTADYLFRGVIVPAGKNLVEFRYEPASFRLGAAISATSLSGLIVIPCFLRWRRKRTPRGPSP